MQRFSHSCEARIMSTVAFPSTAVDAQTPADSAARPAVIRSAQDVSRIVNAGAAQGSNARIVIGIALGGVFLDAYDLTSLAYGIKDIARQFSLSPVQVGFVSSAITTTSARRSRPRTLPPGTSTSRRTAAACRRAAAMSPRARTSSPQNARRATAHRARAVSAIH